MANVFDENWNRCFDAELANFGESVVVGGITCNAAILEFSRLDGISAGGGRSSQIGGQLVMSRANWEQASAGKNSQRATVRGFACRVSQKPTDSLDLTNVTLEIVAESGF
jgi:hypothetical protein